jgi:hypothetical protein
VSDIYQRPVYAGSAFLRDAIERDDPHELAELVIAAALYEEDYELLESACVRLARHPDETVRGNAILGFGHMARLFGKVGKEAVDLVRHGLSDPSGYVRGQAYAAAGDLSHFLGVPIDRGASGNG